MVAYTIKPTPPMPLAPADLVAFRERMGWSARELASALGCTYAAVWRWERGDREIPGPVCAAVALFDAAMACPRTSPEAGRTTNP